MRAHSAARLGFAGFLVATACAAQPAPHGAPPPIRDESARFTNGEVTLSGTLVVAGGGGRHPAVVLFHGSGPEARNLRMARWWASQGVTALTYDKRGVGESTGDFGAVPFMDLSRDGLAGVAWLKTRPDVDPARIGVWGLSQGGWLAPLAAAQSSDIAFVVAVSGPGVSPGEQMLFYYANQVRQAGATPADVARMTALRREAWTAASTGQAVDQARTHVETARQTATNDEVKTELADLQATLDGKHQIWTRQEMQYDPVPALRALAVPSLFLFGTADTLVPVDRSVAVIRQTLTDAHRSDFTIRIIDGANHVMDLSGPDGRPRPSDEYYAALGAWVRAHVTH